jgi:hypothetical protein
MSYNRGQQSRFAVQAQDWKHEQEPGTETWEVVSLELVPKSSTGFEIKEGPGLKQTLAKRIQPPSLA